MASAASVWSCAASLVLLATLVQQCTPASAEQLVALPPPGAGLPSPQSTSHARPVPRLLIESAAEEGPVPATEQLQPVPPQFVITNSTLGSFLKHTASPAHNAIIFTTTRMPERGWEPAVAMMNNFCRWLDHVGVLGFTMLLTTDIATWHTLNARGFPVVLDRVFPERQDYRDGHGFASDTPNRVFDVQKHYWGSTIIRHGFRALYMDSDAIVLRNPLRYFNADYDVQGLSDWYQAELPKVGEALHRSCGMYAQVPDARVGTGSMLKDKWHYTPHQAERALNVANPCQSTGLWYLEPTPMAMRFMAAMSDRVLAPETLHQWEQAAWNEVIVPFLWGMGDEPPLRYRLLPASLFANAVATYEARLQAGLPVDPVVLHGGFMHGDDKQATYERLGLFYGDFSLPARPAPGVGGTLAPLGAATITTVPVEEPRTAAITADGHGSRRTALGTSGLLLGVVATAGCVAGMLLWRRDQFSLARVVRFRSNSPLQSP